MKAIHYASLIVLAVLVLVGVSYITTRDIWIAVLGIVALPTVLHSIPWAFAENDHAQITQEQLDELVEQRMAELEDEDHRAQSIGFTAQLESETRSK